MNYRLHLLLIFLALLTVPSTMTGQFDSAPLKAKYGKVRFLSDSRSGNWFMALSGGAQTLMNGGFLNQSEQRINPAASVSFGKMLAPEWGIRLNTNGGEVAGNLGKVRYGSANLDFLLNLTTLSRGYKEWRFFELTFFAGPGYLHTLSRNVGYPTNKPTVHIGMVSSFRLSRITNLNIEVQNNIAELPTEAGGISAITAGLNFKIGKRRYTAYIPEETLSYQTYRETLLFQAEIKRLRDLVYKSTLKPDTIVIRDTVYIQMPRSRYSKSVVNTKQ